MLSKIKSYIEENNLIQEGDRIIIGVSGGADSVCLFHVLLRLKEAYRLTLFVLHVNHGIRGEEADRDEAFVEETCRSSYVPFTAIHANIPEIVAREGLSEEEAGRFVRYEAFFQYLKKYECNKIAIAHNKNDNAETILFHLFRGSGIKGLTGIQAKRDNIIRPLLCVERDEIETFLKKNGIDYCVDKTNLMEEYSRNKIRHRIISFAQEEINPRAIEHIVNSAIQLKEIESYLESNILSAYERCVLMIKDEDCYEILWEPFGKEDVVIRKGILRVVYNRLAHQLKDISALHIQLILELFEKEVGKSLDLPYGVQAVKGYHSVIMKKTQYPKEELPAAGSGTELVLKFPGEYYIPQIDKILKSKLINYKKNMIIPKNRCTKWFDYDKIKDTVLIRSRKEGDYIQIDTRGSRKKLKSLFIDEKVPREKRDYLPLLADGSHIMWILGGRTSEAYRINEETKTILEINLNGGKGNEG